MSFRSLVDRHLARIGQAIDENEPGHRPSSLASSDLDPLESRHAIENAIGYGNVLIDVAADFCFGLGRALEVEDGITTIAPWALSRNVLEHSARACWVLDLDISRELRAHRSIVLEFEAAREKHKFVRAAKLEMPPEQMEMELQEIADRAKAAGLVDRRDPRGRLVGFSLPFPRATELVEVIFAEGASYRLYSGVAHGYAWALYSTGLQATYEGETPPRVRKHLDQETAGMLVAKSLMWLARAIWLRTLYFGWEQGPFRTVFEAQADELGLRNELRFWRL